jgi:hypothetical protein
MRPGFHNRFVYKGDGLRGRLLALPVLVVVMAQAMAANAAAEEPPTPESRAIAFLAVEVPRWSKENKCFSCHNNGDAARALYQAVRLELPVPPSALADTNAWLSRPEGWDKNGGDGPFSDKRLARVQFALALAEAVDVRQVRDRQILVRAAERVAAEQAADGSWPIDEAGVGSPATYGRPLAACLARDVLARADAERFRKQIEQADRWLRKQPIADNVGASAALLAFGRHDDAEASALRLRCLDMLKRGQAHDGGWGPYPISPPEPFDTALVILALKRLDPNQEIKSMIERGRTFLIANQGPDGSWPETTRPSGRDSYAERLSTAGWATLALLATRKPAAADRNKAPVPAGARSLHGGGPHLER